MNLGGGFKVGRMPEEPTVDLADVGAHVRAELLAFQSPGRPAPRSRDRARHVPRRARRRGGGQLHRRRGHRPRGRYLFAKLDTGMTEVTRPSLYGAQHPIDVLAQGRRDGGGRLRGPLLRVGRHPHAGSRRPRGARAPLGSPCPRSATSSWWAGPAPTAPRCPRSTTTRIRRAPEVDAGTGRHLAPSPAPPGACRGLGRRGLSQRTRALAGPPAAGRPKASSGSAAV